MRTPKEKFMTVQKPIVLSLKPKWAEAILSGSKTVEIRRRFPLADECNVRTLIYTSSPTKSLTGEAVIEKIAKFTIDEIWSLYGPSTMVSRQLLDEYLGDLGHGTLLFLRDAKPLRNSIPLDQLRQRHKFTAPQSFAYAKEALLEEIDSK